MGLPDFGRWTRSKRGSKFNSFGTFLRTMRKHDEEGTLDTKRDSMQVVSEDNREVDPLVAALENGLYQIGRMDREKRYEGRWQFLPPQAQGPYCRGYRDEDRRQKRGES